MPALQRAQSYICSKRHPSGKNTTLHASDLLEPKRQIISMPSLRQREVTNESCNLVSSSILSSRSVNEVPH
ncbi:hypothetical protein ACS0TY_020821 [Phlomoides rotata]